jgi:hypothetical protein
MIIIPGIYNAQTHIPGGNVQGQVITVGAILKVTERDRRPYPSDPGTPSEIWIDNTAAIGYVCKEVGPNGTVWDRLDVLGDYIAFGDNDPGVNADITWGYRPGSLRYARNSEILWVCKDNTQGAAVWNVLSSGGSVVSVNGQTGVVQLYLDDLLDVDAPLPTNGDVLTWDSATSTWIALAPTGGGGTYTVDNGLTPQTSPSINPNNFQLGGTLIKPTVITAQQINANNSLRFDAPSNLLNSLGAFQFTAINTTTYTPTAKLASFRANDCIAAYFETDIVFGSSSTAIKIKSLDVNSIPLLIENSNISEILKVNDSGQLSLSEYNTATAFQGSSGGSVGVLNVDNAGKVFVGTGGGGTYTVNNGLTENPANNFQLGGALNKNTTINGVAYTYDLFFTNLRLFRVNSLGKSWIQNTTFPGVVNSVIIDSQFASITAEVNSNAYTATVSTDGDSTSGSELVRMQSFITYPGGTIGFGAYKLEPAAAYLQIRTPNVNASIATVGQVLALANPNGEVEFINAPSGTGTVQQVDTGTGLTGGPITVTGSISLNSKLAPADSIAGNAGKFLRVNAGETAVEYATVTGGGGLLYGVASGTNSYSVTITGAPATYTDGDTYVIKFTNGNDDDSSISINGGVSKNLVKQFNVRVTGGDIASGQELIIIYDGTNFQTLGVAPNQLFAYVTNDDTVALTKGMPVYAYGAAGNRMSVKRASNLQDSTSAQTVGLVFSSSIGVNQKGFIITQGVLSGIDTSAYASGEQIYLGDTPGTYWPPAATLVPKPYAPNHLVYLGIVERSNAGNGQIYVKPQNGYELNEIHDVDLITNLPTNNQVLSYQTGTPNLWKNKNVIDIAPTSLKTGSCGVTFDGQGGTISNGKTAYVQIPYNGTLTSWTLVANTAGNCTVTAFKSTYGSFPPTSPGGNLYSVQPSITAPNQKNQNLTPTYLGSQATVTAGDWIGFTISGVTTVSWVNLTISITKT